MNIALYGIMGRQYIGKTGNGSITFFDLETSREVNVTLVGTVLPGQVIDDKTPRHFLISGAEMRTFEGRTTIYATAIGENSAAPRPAKGS